MPAFLKHIGDQFEPAAAAVGPWGPQTVSGMVIAGLVGYVAEAAGGDDDFVGARLTVDMVRMAAMSDLATTSRIVREGRRLRLVDVTIEQEGRSVALGRAIFVRRSEQPSGTVWSDPAKLPPLPADDRWPTHGGGLAYSAVDGSPSEDFDIWRDAAAPKLVWFRMPIDLVEGEATSQYVRAACIADVVNPLVNWGSEGLQFVNSDVTMQLARLPEGYAIGMVARDRQEESGVSTGVATMHDSRGPIGLCTATALVSPFTMTPNHLKT